MHCQHLQVSCPACAHHGGHARVHAGPARGTITVSNHPRRLQLTIMFSRWPWLQLQQQAHKDRNSVHTDQSCGSALCIRFSILHSLHVLLQLEHLLRRHVAVMLHWPVRSAFKGALKWTALPPPSHLHIQSAATSRALACPAATFSA